MKFNWVAPKLLHLGDAVHNLQTLYQTPIRGCFGISINENCPCVICKMHNNCLLTTYTTLNYILGNKLLCSTNQRSKLIKFDCPKKFIKAPLLPHPGSHAVVFFDVRSNTGKFLEYPVVTDMIRSLYRFDPIFNLGDYPLCGTVNACHLSLYEKWKILCSARLAVGASNGLALMCAMTHVPTYILTPNIKREAFMYPKNSNVMLIHPDERGRWFDSNKL